MYSICTGFDKVGSFIGPFIFNNLAPITHKAVPFVGLAFISVLCVLGSFLLVETGGKEIPLTGQDVEKRRKNYKYKL